MCPSSSLYRLNHIPTLLAGKMTPPSRLDGHLFSSSSENELVGWHFNPTDVEILAHFLQKKNGNDSFSAEPIRQWDIYECNPDELARKFQVGGEDMYFFTQLNHEGGLRTVRKAGDGSWKATNGRKRVEHQGKVIGWKMNLKFNISGSNAEKTNWLMTEYRTNLPTVKTTTKAGRENVEGKDDHRNGVNEFVLYRIREKMGAKKTNDAPVNEVIAKDDILNKIDKVNPPTMKTMTKAYYGNKKRMIKDDAKEKRAAKKTKKAPMINEVSMEDHTSYRIDKANPPIVKTMTESGCGNWKRMAAIQVDHGKQMNDFVPNENHKNEMVAQKSNKAPINEITAERQVSNLTLEDETNIIQGNKDTFWNQLGDLSIVEDGYPALKLSQSTMGDDSQKMIGKEIKELDNNIPPEVDTWFADFSDSSEENISPEVNTCSTNFIDNSQETTWKELENIDWEVDTCPANFNTNYDSPLPSQL